MNTRRVGGNGEDLAVEYLTRLGWAILDRNVHCRVGEIDILADNGKEVVLVEVKAKRSCGYGRAVEMVTPAKQRTLRTLAKRVESAYNKPVRIDIIAIDGFGSHSPELTHYPFAVGE